MVDVIAVIKAGRGSTLPLNRRALKDTQRRRRRTIERGNPTGRGSYADQLRQDMNPPPEEEGDFMDIGFEDPSDLEGLRTQLAYQLRNQPAKDPQIVLNAYPMDLAWQLLKEQITDFSSLPEPIQSLMTRDAASRERLHQDELRGSQRRLHGGKKAFYTAQQGKPIGEDLTPDQRTLRIAPGAPSSIPAGGSPDLEGESDMPGLGDEEFFEEQYVPHSDWALDPWEEHPQPEVGAADSFIDAKGKKQPLTGESEGPTRLRDRTNRMRREVTSEDAMATGRLAEQIDMADAGLERYDSMINAIKDGPAKDQMIANKKTYQDKVLGPLVQAMHKKKQRLQRQAPWEPTTQRYEYGVERTDTPSPFPEDGE